MDFDAETDWYVMRYLRWTGWFCCASAVDVEGLDAPDAETRLGYELPALDEG